MPCGRFPVLVVIFERFLDKAGGAMDAVILDGYTIQSLAICMPSCKPNDLACKELISKYHS